MSSNRSSASGLKRPSAKANGNAEEKVFKPAASRAQPSTLSAITVKMVDSDDEASPTLASIESTPRVAEKGNLRIPDSAYKQLSGFTTKIDALLRQQQSLKRTYEAMVKVVNRSEVPGVTRIKSIPSAPQGVVLSDTFKREYQKKCDAYGVKLACLLLNEYRGMVDRLQMDIDLVVVEGEDSLATIEDLSVRNKAVELFHIKHRALVRRVNQDRRHVKARRRLTHQ